MIVGIVVLVVAFVVAMFAMATIGGLFLAILPSAVVGLLAGWVASKVTGTRLGLGWTVLAGIAGSWLGDALFSSLLHVHTHFFLHPVHLVASVLGATILITFTRAVARPALTGTSHPRLGRYS